MTINVYLGIDVGSVTTKLALVDETGKYIDSYMLRTSGKPVVAVQTGMRELIKQALCDYNIQGVGTTGSGRNLAGALVGAGTGAYMDIQASKLRQELVGTGVQVQEMNGQVRLIMPSNITFATDSAVFQTSFNRVLDSVAKVINEFSQTKVQVTGYTDNTGTAAINNKLSAERANSVATYLKLRGVASGRVMAAGLGSSNPIATNATAAGREQNRRVEISLINMQ